MGVPKLSEKEFKQISDFRGALIDLAKKKYASAKSFLKAVEQLTVQRIKIVVDDDDDDDSRKFLSYVFESLTQIKIISVKPLQVELLFKKIGGTGENGTTADLIASNQQVIASNQQVIASNKLVAEAINRAFNNTEAERRHDELIEAVNKVESNTESDIGFDMLIVVLGAMLLFGLAVVGRALLRQSRLRLNSILRSPTEENRSLVHRDASTTTPVTVFLPEEGSPDIPSNQLTTRERRMARTVNMVRRIFTTVYQAVAVTAGEASRFPTQFNIEMQPLANEQPPQTPHSPHALGGGEAGVWAAIATGALVTVIAAFVSPQ
nr:hypothetical protein TetV2_00201 [Oceanusvirus sp.]